MTDLKVGNKVEIHAFKHSGSLHRSWRKAIVIEKENNQLVLGNYHAKVFESDGRSWHTQEPAITFFMEKKFFNVIAMIKKDGIYFYCNLASPYIYDKEGVKYIDYDLDIRVTPDFSYVILDENEYLENKRLFKYPQDLQKVIKNQLDELEQMIYNRDLPFNHEYILELYEKYKELENKDKWRK